MLGCEKSLIRDLKSWKFRNPPNYAELPINEDPEYNVPVAVKNAVFSKVPTEPLIGKLNLVCVSEDAMKDILDLDPEVAETVEFVDMVAGKYLPEGGLTVCHRYGGYQFGYWADQLGDGRAHILGEYVNRCKTARLMKAGSFEIACKVNGSANFEESPPIKMAIEQLLNDKYVKWYSEVAHTNLDMVASWQGVGFTHGVLNTDNVSVLGLTIDYGPYGFMQHYYEHYVPNTSDDAGRKGESWQPQLKGSGETPYSRFGDGRAVLRSSIREMIASEACYYLGIPTTRAAALVESDEHKVWRDKSYSGAARQEPAAVVMRLAPAWYRLGSFEILLKRNEPHTMRQLADFVIKHHFPNISSDDPDKYVKWYSEVAHTNLDMVASWQDNFRNMGPIMSGLLLESNFMLK
ncbi:UPF0061 protein [Papilio machaon]|uniref:Selenoprotein O n=1 Tax=Papilio machaon TaxID=76193 RepID=A0A194R2B7_PAPMA|nr:UPF0061 protein [Papilio machaon]